MLQAIQPIAGVLAGLAGVLLLGSGFLPKDFKLPKLGGLLGKSEDRQNLRDFEALEQLRARMERQGCEQGVTCCDQLLTHFFKKKAA